MFEKLTQFSLERKKTVITLFVFLGVFGFFSFFILPKAEDPGFTVRSAVVSTAIPGASASRMEILVTDKLEKVIQQIPEVEKIESVSETGLSTIIVEVKEKYHEMGPIWDVLRKKMKRAKQDLPIEALGPFVNDEFGDVFGSVITVSSVYFSDQEMKKVARELRDELLFLPDVAKVELLGEQQERVYIDFDWIKLAQLGLSTLQIRTLLESQNILLSGGHVFTAKENLFLEPTGNFSSVEDVENMTLAIPGKKGLIALKDLAKIERRNLTPTPSRVFYRQKPAVALAISLQRGGNILQLGKNLQTLLKEWQDNAPSGLHFDLVINNASDVKGKVAEFVLNMGQSVAIVIFVMILFFGLRSGLIVASLIPLTILLTLAAMQFLGIGVDQISLASLIIALGMMVDNAIVIFEGIANDKRQKTREEKCVVAVKSYSKALLIATLTTAAAFLPIFLAQSKVGEYTASLFKVVTIALLISWILSLVWVPLMMVHFYRERVLKKERVNAFLKKKYTRFLGLCLASKKTFLISILGLFVLAIFGFTFLPNSFFPENKKPVLTLELKMPTGTHLGRTQEVVQAFGKYFSSQDALIDDWVVFLGESAPRYALNYIPSAGSAEKAYFYLNTVSSNHSLIEKIEVFAASCFPEVQLHVKKLFYGTPTKADIGFRLFARDAPSIRHMAASVKEKLRSFEEVKNIRDDWGEKRKKLVVNIDETRALRAGVTNRDVAISLQSHLTGFETSFFREKEDLIPIVLRFNESGREDINALKATQIISADAQKTVPLLQVADVEVQFEEGNIARNGNKKAITILADLRGRSGLKKINKEMKVFLKAQEKNFWAPSSSWEWSGEKEEASSSEKSIYLQIPIAALCILLLLVFKFDSFRKVGIVLSTIPLTLIGITFGLFVLKIDFGFMAFLGMVALSGIIINYAIVMLDQIALEERKCDSLKKAVLKAGRARLLPIFLSMSASCLGLLPLIVGGGVFVQMAVVIVFGLAFGGLITTVFVPVLYFLLFKR